MKKNYVIAILFFVLILCSKNYVYAADPHLTLSPSSGTLTSSGIQIDVQIDTGGQEAKSAKAVINFDSSKVEVSSIQAGTFFDDVSHNIYSNQVIINANLSLGSSLESKTGVGTLATMTVNSKSNSGTASLTFDCTMGDSTDSGINDPTPTDIIVCSENINGTYNLGSSSPNPNPSPNPSPSPDAGTGGAEDPSPVPTPSELPESGTVEYTFGVLALGFALLFIGIPAYIFK
jgi:hypothetical protein